MNDDLDRTIADGLRHRADAMPVTPMGLANVQHRITRARQRTATFAAAAVMVPAAVGLAYVVGHRGDERPVSLGTPPMTTIVPMATTTTSGEFPYGYRCQSLQSQDEVWSYYAYCEPVTPNGVPMTTMFVTLPPELAPTTTDALLGGSLVVVDATGGLPVQEMLATRGIVTYELLVGQRTVPQTMVVPIGDDLVLASRVLELVPLFAGFGTWDSTLIDGPVPDGATALLVLGADAFDHFAPVTTLPPDVPCTPGGPPTSFPPVPTSTITLEPMTTLPPAPTTTTC